MVAHAAVYNGAVTRGSAQSSSTGRYNRPLHGAQLLIAPTRPELLLCLKGNAAALSVSTALTATCQNAMAAIERSASAELLAHRPLAGLLTPYGRQLSVGNCFALDGPNVASDSNQTPKN
jgi:hypothetical protein